MNQICIGLITEGVTDQVVMEILLSAAIWKNGTKPFMNIQPNPDNTSINSRSERGWRQVYQWCKRNAPEFRHHRFRGLFTSSPSCQALLVHLDADICTKPEFQNTSKIAANDFDLSMPTGRGQYITAVLTDWLWPDGTPSTDVSWTIPAPAVEAIETWLIAGLTHEPHPETNQNPFSVLQQWAENIENRKLARKTPERYRQFAEKAAQNVDTILEQCPHFAALTEKLLFVR